MGKRSDAHNQPISWHRECLANWQASNERSRREAERALAMVVDSERRAAEYAAQIHRAVAMGKERFDAERFGVKRASRA